MDSNQFERAALALYLWREHRQSGLEAMTAVGFCVRNRVRDWKLSWTEAIAGVPHTADQNYPDTRDPVFLRLLARVDCVFDETMDDLSADAHFFSPHRQDQLTAVVGSMHFYA